ncbi:hypothetical protein BDAP_001995 [Binucleata daphniae]
MSTSDCSLTTDVSNTSMLNEHKTHFVKGVRRHINDKNSTDRRSALFLFSIKEEDIVSMNSAFNPQNEFVNIDQPIMRNKRNKDKERSQYNKQNGRPLQRPHSMFEINYKHKTPSFINIRKIFRHNKQNYKAKI